MHALGRNIRSKMEYMYTVLGASFVGEFNCIVLHGKVSWQMVT